MEFVKMFGGIRKRLQNFNLPHPWSDGIKIVIVCPNEDVRFSLECCIAEEMNGSGLLAGGFPLLAESVRHGKCCGIDYEITVADPPIDGSSDDVPF